ncbi:Zinc-binding dehydrogenase [Ceratobasidium sp. AG-Ba]|nr:Zinc-binding dehydrogenase [Ceratobasidium sp. AG-Ba]
MSQGAFMLLAKGGKNEVGTRSIPTPQATQVLVKVAAAAINPVDHKIAGAPTSGSEPHGVTLLTTPPATGGHYGTVGPLADDLKAKLGGKTNCHSVFGSSQTDKPPSILFWKILTQWLREGKLVPNNLQLVTGGLDGIPEAPELSKKEASG